MPSKGDWEGMFAKNNRTATNTFPRKMNELEVPKITNSKHHKLVAVK